MRTLRANRCAMKRSENIDLSWRSPTIARLSIRTTDASVIADAVAIRRG
jgi:hypothetical protein